MQKGMSDKHAHSRYDFYVFKRRNEKGGGNGV